MVFDQCPINVVIAEELASHTREELGSWMDLKTRKISVIIVLNFDFHIFSFWK